MIAQAKDRWWEWLSHPLLTLGAAVVGGSLAHYVLVLWWLPWQHGALLGASAAAGFYLDREGGDRARHRAQAEWLRMRGRVEEARRYLRVWMIDCHIQWIGPALVWALVMALVLVMGG